MVKINIPVKPHIKRYRGYWAVYLSRYDENCKAYYVLTKFEDALHAAKNLHYYVNTYYFVK